MSANIIDVNLDEFDDKVIGESDTRPVLVDFWAEWCPPCLVIAPVLKQVIEAHAGKLLLAKVEVDEGDNMKLAGHYRVRGFPTVILFNEGTELGRFSGAKSRNAIETFVATHLPGPAQSSMPK